MRENACPWIAKDIDSNVHWLLRFLGLLRRGSEMHLDSSHLLVGLVWPEAGVAEMP